MFMLLIAKRDKEIIPTIPIKFIKFKILYAQKVLYSFSINLIGIVRYLIGRTSL